MSLSEALGDLEPKGQGGRCFFANLADDLDAETWAVLESRLTDDRYRHTDIADILSANGYKVTHQTVGRHRRHKCECP